MTRFKKILLSAMVIGALGTITTVRVLAVLSADTQNPGSSIASGTFTANMTLSGGSGTCYTYKGTGTFTMTLSSAAAATNTSITVSSVPAAIALGTVLRLDDKSLTAGGHTELVTVSSNVGASGSPTVIAIAGVPGLVNSYAAGTKVFTDDYNEQGCDAIYSYNSGTLSPLMYPGVPQTAHVTLVNDGSVDVNDLSVWMPTCTKVDTPGIPAYAHLGADPCAANGPIFYIQETQSDFATTDSTHHCWYPSTANTCPLTGSLNNFSTNDNSQVFSVNMGAGPKRADSTANTRYFVIGTEEPTNASNLLQGEAATFTLSWYLTSS